MMKRSSRPRKLESKLATAGGKRNKNIVKNANDNKYNLKREAKYSSHHHVNWIQNRTRSAWLRKLRSKLATAAGRQNKNIIKHTNESNYNLKWEAKYSSSQHANWKQMRQRSPWVTWRASKPPREESKPRTLLNMRVKTIITLSERQGIHLINTLTECRRGHDLHDPVNRRAS